MLPKCYFELRVVNDPAIEPNCIKELVSFAVSRQKGWLTLVDCATTMEKLDAIHESLRYSKNKVGERVSSMVNSSGLEEKATF